jgi:hypothetical protein
MAKVNQIFFAGTSSLSEFWLFDLLFSFQQITESIPSAQTRVAYCGPTSPRNKKLFSSFNIYNEASETFAGA